MCIFDKQFFIILFNACAALLIYGGWAVYANFEHGLHAGVTAGIVQGVYAFISTLTITLIAKAVYQKCGCGVRGICLGFCTSFIIMITIPLSVHTAFGTPDIWQTILPGLIWGSIYLLGVLVVFERHEQAKR